MDGQHNPSGYPTHNGYGSSSINQYSYPASFHPPQTPAFPTLYPLHISPRERQLENEIAQLQRQLAVLSNQRQSEQQAYIGFVNQAFDFNQAIPHHHRPPQYSQAYQTLVNASQCYVQAQQQAQLQAQRYERTPAHQPILEEESSITDKSTSAGLESQRTKDSMAELKSHLKSQLTDIAALLRSMNHRLQSFRLNKPGASCAVASNPRQRLAGAAKILENNITTFTNCLTTYINDRYDILGVKLRPKLKDLLEPFFADPNDARTLMVNIVQEAKAIAKVETKQVKPLAEDLIAPLRELLAALIGVLEDLESGVGGD